jgi:pyruvate dehydrogenase E2 component (dihydrolipoamide acetyltransferase)
LGVDLALLRGSGRKGRILKTDVQAFVKGALGAGAPIRIPETVVQFELAPEIDFASFGEVEVQPLARIRRLSAAHLHRSWVTVPHVTQHDEADITDLEAFRKQHGEEAEKRGVKLTMLPFLMKAVVAATKEYPQFGASLDRSGENLIIKKYYHLGIAVDTPNGLLVPVIRDVDRKSAFDLAEDLAHMSERARSRKLRPQDLQGGCFSISSLGGIGGTAFTPVVNTPEVAILGVSRSARKPVWVDAEFVSRLMLPLSLSYDHRVIDGADAVRFTTRLCELLADVRSLLLL